MLNKIKSEPNCTDSLQNYITTHKMKKFKLKST